MNTAMALSKPEFAEMAANSYRLRRFVYIRLDPSPAAVDIGKRLIRRS